MTMNWKGLSRKRLWPNFKVLSSINLEGLRKTVKNHSQDSQLLGLRFEPRVSRIRSRRVNHDVTLLLLWDICSCMYMKPYYYL
jgi:hypothetical protein